jgi:arylsulfatase A-like enzyme
MGKKNVVILHTDQQRYDSLGCSGNAYARTPNLDALAAEGTLFSRHMSANPICMPSRASLMTGLYPPGHNVWTNGVPLNRHTYANVEWGPEHWGIDVVPEPPTLADVFAEAGYDTVALGKLHLTPNLAPVSYGFPEAESTWEAEEIVDWHGPYYGFRYVDLTIGHGEQVCRGGHYGAWLKDQHPEVLARLDARDPSTGSGAPYLRDLYTLPMRFEHHYTSWLAERFCDYLERERPGEQPFFAFVGFPDPHHPFTPCEDIEAQFHTAAVRDPSDSSGEGLVGVPARALAGLDITDMPEEVLWTVLRNTDAMIYQIDLAVGRILDALKVNGLWEDTVVLFTSDHGDFLGDHGRLRKGTLSSDALLHVPLLVRAPGADLPQRYDAPVSNCDVMPTIAKLVGIEAPPLCHGRDVFAQAASEPYALAYCANGDPRYTSHTVVDQDHRMTWYPHSGYVELFDHRHDPGERVNLAARSEYQGSISLLMDVLRERMLGYYHPIVGRVCLW